MYAKKILYTAATAPALGKQSFPILIISVFYSVFMHQAAEYQNRHADDKEHEAKRRQQ